MRTWLLVAAAVFASLSVAVSDARSQQKPSTADRPAEPARIIPAEIRRQAAQRAEFRALLADPDPDVRLLTMREAILHGDEAQRSAAIDMGLASNETAMLEQALRGALQHTNTIIIEFLDKDAKLTTEGDVASLRLAITSFDPATGVIEGLTACRGEPKFKGQLQGTVLSFQQAYCSGTLRWSSETADFRGRVNLSGGDARNNRNGVWKPR